MTTSDDKLCFYVPGKPGIIDLAVDRGGKYVGLHSGETQGEIDARYPGVQIGLLNEIEAASRALFRRRPEEISAAKFQEMLEVLPPVDWINRGHAETFKLCERTYNTITAIFCRLGDRYFALADDITTPHDVIVTMVTEFAKQEGQAS